MGTHLWSLKSNLQKSIINNKTNYDYPNRRSIENLENPLPRRCHGRQERHPINPRRHQSPKPLRYESSPKPQIQRTRQGELHLATLPLGLDRRRYHLPPRTTQSPRKRYAKHLETNPRATGPTRPTTKQSRRRTTSLRKPRRLPTKPRRWCR